MKVEIWSDILCPWCYIGKREFETALAAFEHGEKVEVTWRSFQLDPNAALDYDHDTYDRVAQKYQITRAKSKLMHTNLESRAATVGLTYNFDATIPTNSFDAHRLIHFAATYGLEHAMVERLSAAYLTEGKHIGRKDVLQQLAVEVGLDPSRTIQMLAGNEFSNEVRIDEKEAVDLGIRGVPFFVIDRKYGISGAQLHETFLEALQQAWIEGGQQAGSGKRE